MNALTETSVCNNSEINFWTIDEQDYVPVGLWLKGVFCEFGLICVLYMWKVAGDLQYLLYSLMWSFWGPLHVRCGSVNGEVK